MEDSLPYGFSFDRDYLMDTVYWVKTLLPIACSLTVYPANLYLLLVEIPQMMTEIRAAYLTHLITLIFFDLTWNFLTRSYVLPPYGLFYCKGPLCQMGLDKSTVVILLAICIMICIPAYYVLMMRMHQIIVRHTESKWSIPWKLELTMYVGLMALSIANAAGFGIFCHDVPNHATANSQFVFSKPELRWLHERGGIHVIYSEPGVMSDFVHELQIFAGSFAVYLPPLMFFAVHALLTLNRRASTAFSSKTQVLTRQLFHVFNFQLRGAILFFVLPLSSVLAAGIIDTRTTFSGSNYALFRLATQLLFSLNPVQFATIFIIRNATHRAILLKRMRRTTLFAVIRQLVGGNQITRVAITDRSGREVRSE